MPTVALVATGQTVLEHRNSERRLADHRNHGACCSLKTIAGTVYLGPSVALYTLKPRVKQQRDEITRLPPRTSVELQNLEVEFPPPLRG